MIKSKSLETVDGQLAKILHDGSVESVLEVMKTNRNIVDDRFFFPEIDCLHDPYLLPDMEKAVERILRARESGERIVIFGDYDVDGVSSTALLVRFFADIGCQISYRLPHRVHDGYGLKEYFFDELSEKYVTLVITVDCGTRDIGPVEYAKSLGIDVIITDHHAVPKVVPQSMIALINPKRQDSGYPFRDLAGAGVALKLVDALLRRLQSSHPHLSILDYIDFASLGTVADCMPLIGENRVITALGLRQMSQSKSKGIQRFLSQKEKKDHDADIIGFQIGPRINAAGRMDTPITALKWLLAREDTADSFFEELEHLNEHRKKITEAHFEKAQKSIRLDDPILIFDHGDFEHGIIGLVAGRLTEMYGKPSIIIKNGHEHPLTRRKGDEIDIDETLPDRIGGSISVASCRSPEWCSIITLLEECRDLFIRFGGHRQAAGFTIETAKIPELKQRLYEAFEKYHDPRELPRKIISIECRLDPENHINHDVLDMIDRFRPFGIGNHRPLFLLENVTITEVRVLGARGDHRELRILENITLRIIAWRVSENFDSHFIVGNQISLIVELEGHEWKGKKSIQAVMKNYIL